MDYLSVLQGRNRENWGHENGHQSMGQFPKCLNLDPGLLLTGHGPLRSVWGQLVIVTLSNILNS